MSYTTAEDKVMLNEFLRQYEDEDWQTWNSNMANIQCYAFLLLTWIGAGTPIQESMDMIEEERKNDKYDVPVRKEWRRNIFQFAVPNDLDRTCQRMAYLVERSTYRTVQLAKMWREEEPEHYAKYE